MQNFVDLHLDFLAISGLAGSSEVPYSTYHLKAERLLLDPDTVHADAVHRADGGAKIHMLCSLRSGPTLVVRDVIVVCVPSRL